MSDDPDLTEQLLDLMVYVPIGLALEARDLLPKLAERGRGQVNLIRFAGKVASGQGAGPSRTIFDQFVATVGAVLGGPEPAATAAPPTSSPTEPVAGDDAADGLPIVDYDSMSAPQLLPFLEPLSDTELADVLDYEERHRSRATVINRIRQLQG